MDRLLLLEVLRWCLALVVVLSRAITLDGDVCIPLGVVEDKYPGSMIQFEISIREFCRAAFDR